MLESGKFAKQMIDFYKSTFDNSFNAMVMLQEQTEKTMKTALDQATWLPAEGKKVVDEWVKAYKQGREEFKKSVDENFKKVDDFFSQSAK
jgi:polyhydroxyalkanoate synthesis regulator phasin